jgi:ABC-2 type transport system ATP-binding protein
VSLPRNAIAVCPDVPEFDGWLTAYEVVDLSRALVAPGGTADASSHALQITGLADVGDCHVGGFSRG